MNNTEKNSYSKIAKCRISDSTNLIDILDLGRQPLANSLKKHIHDHEEKIPLTISFCPESSLVQLNETVNKNILFDHYVWVTGTSAGAKKYSEIFCDRVLERINPQKNDLIIEIASNDGSFLKPFIRRGYQNAVGIEPAINIAELAEEEGIRTINDYWNIEVSKKVIDINGNAKVVFARNVIPHVEDLFGVIQGIQFAMSDDGVGIIEFHQAGKILSDLQYDSIYHEHLCYFSIKSIQHLLNRFDLFPFHIDVSPISGGSFVIYFSRDNREKSKEMINYSKEEETNKVNELESWIKFAQMTKEHKQQTLDILNTLKNKKILGFGSSARSQTYLNYCEIDNSQLYSIIDNNPLKQGLFTPGSSIPIISREKGMNSKPDIIFILAWNFKDEIMAECKSYGYQGEFLIPFPNEPYFTK